MLVPLLAGARERGLPLLLVSLFALVQMLGSPVWIGGFVLFALIAPGPDLRRRLLIAGAIEVVIAGCGVLHFLTGRPPL